MIELNAAARLTATQVVATEKPRPGLKAGETVQPAKSLGGQLVLFKNGLPRVFANRKQAQEAAERTGGQAFQSPASGRFLVRYAE